MITDDNKISKTKRKKAMEEIQDFGVSLLKLSVDQLLKLKLPHELEQAIIFAKTIKSNKALKRQSQYIGKLMRDLDASQIQAKYDVLFKDSKQATRLMHECELLREEILTHNDNLEKFLHNYQVSLENKMKLLSLVESLRLSDDYRQNKNYKLLFRLIYEILKTSL